MQGKNWLLLFCILSLGELIRLINILPWSWYKLDYSTELILISISRIIFVLNPFILLLFFKREYPSFPLQRVIVLLSFFSLGTLFWMQSTRFYFFLVYFIFNFPFIILFFYSKFQLKNLSDKRNNPPDTKINVKIVLTKVILLGILWIPIIIILEDNLIYFNYLKNQQIRETLFLFLDFIGFYIIP